MRGVRYSGWLGLAGVLLMAGCGPIEGDGIRVLIFDWHYTPTHLRVRPGQTVYLLNLDTSPHSATSAPHPGRLVPGASDGIAFDTGEFLGEERAFTIPLDAVPGSMVPFYCTVHRDFDHGVGRITVVE